MVAATLPTKFCLILASCLALFQVLVSANFYQGQVDESTRILKECGYVAREYQVTTEDQVMLRLIRATNPLFNQGESGLSQRQPVIYLQGTTLGSALVLENSQGVKPKDFSHLDANKLSREQLLEQVGPDPSSRNFIFLALNCGHEVWILNRRGFVGSRQRVQDLNRTLADAIKAMPDSLLGFKYVGDLSLSGGLNLDEPSKESAASGADRNGEVRAKREAKQFDAESWLTDEMMRLFDKSETFDDKVRALLAPLPLIKMPEGLLLFTDKAFQRDLIETFNPDFWNFSLDEQAKYDLPAIVDFVLEKTQRKKVHLLGLSCGGAIILLGLAENPDLADKVGATVLWAPSVNLGSGADNVVLMSQSVPFVQAIVGPLPALFLNKPLQKIAQRFCTSSVAAVKACRLYFDTVYGYSGKQAKTGALWWANTFVASPINELKHLGQMAHTNVTCKYSFTTPKKNMEVYGQEKAPCYDFGLIKTPNLFFYVSDNDRLVSVADIDATLSQLKVDYTLEHISEEGVYFNHLGYIVHEQNARLSVVPTLKNIASVEAQEIVEDREVNSNSNEQELNEAVNLTA